MINEFWETSGPRYRVVVVSAMGLIAAGILLTILGATTGSRGVQLAGMPFIGLGLVLHLAGLVIRGREVRRRHKDK